MPKEVKGTPDPLRAEPARQGETWRQYVKRLRVAPTLGPSQVAGVMAATVLMGKDPDAPADPRMLEALSQRLAKQSSFRRLCREPETMRLARGGKGAELIVRMGEIKTREQELLRKYDRSSYQVRDDALMLQTAIKSMQDSFASQSAVQKERESKRFMEMIKRMEYARGLAEKGIPLDGKTARELAQVVQRYNDGNGKTPGGKQQAAASKEAMSVLKYLMPQEEFSAYCNEINRAHNAESPTHRRHVEPAYYGKELLQGSARTAKELMAASQRQMNRGLTLDSCAMVTAIMSLSKGNPNAIIRKDALEAEVKRMKQPGSAFLRAMGDEKARERYAQLAADGKAVALSKSILHDAKAHSIRAAQWQINQAVRQTGRDGGTALSEDKMAAILAAREMAMSAGPDSSISNRAFQVRADQIKSSASFTALSEQYRSDPKLRDRINEGLQNGDGGKALAQEYQMANAPQKEKQTELQQPVLKPDSQE